MIRRRVVVHGRVQGVGFRYSVVAAARTRGLAGWVRNREDGAVEAVFEGEPDGVESMVRFSRDGPPGAGVVRLEVSDEEPEGLAGFDVRDDFRPPSPS